MANLPVVQQGMEKVILPNYNDHDQPVEIKLRKELNAQTNAQVLYIEKAKKPANWNSKKLTESITRKENGNGSVFGNKLRTSKKKMISRGFGKVAAAATVQERKKGNPEITFLITSFEFKGYKIWVGKNAESNDTLTQKYAFKDDLWLHAQRCCRFPRFDQAPGWQKISLRTSLNVQQN